MAASRGNRVLTSGPLSSVVTAVIGYHSLASPALTVVCVPIGARLSTDLCALNTTRPKSLQLVGIGYGLTFASAIEHRWILDSSARCLRQVRPYSVGPRSHSRGSPATFPPVRENLHKLLLEAVERSVSLHSVRNLQLSRIATSITQ